MQWDSAKLDPTIIRHALDACQTLHPDAAAADAVAAGLEGFFYADARAGDLRSGVQAQGDEAVESRAVGEEIVYYQHAVALAEVLLRDEDGVFDVVGERVDLAGPELARQIAGAVFLGK